MGTVTFKHSCYWTSIERDPVSWLLLDRVVEQGIPVRTRQVDAAQRVVVGHVACQVIMIEPVSRMPFCPLSHTVLLTRSFHSEPSDFYAVPPVAAYPVFGDVVPVARLVQQDPILVIEPGCVVE